MPNNYFQFKEFTVQQEDCAMKVTTDACLFGAWAAMMMNSEQWAINNILDIGTGTGLLSLMLAQKATAQIHAVEIEEAAANQAAGNFSLSPWKDRLHVHPASIQQFSNRSTLQFDFIITNPPFFDNDLKSESPKRNLALHGSSLSLEELLKAIKINLSPNGKLAILLPYHRTDYFIDLAEEFYLQKKALVKQTEKHPYFRSMLLLSRMQVTTKETEIIIKQNSRYSAAFTYLLEDYYLHL